MALLDYQVEPYGLLCEHLERHKRALIVMATGLGKTWIAAHYVDEKLHKRGLGLVLCHNTDILEQTMNVFKELLGSRATFGSFNGVEKDFHEVDILFATFQTFKEWKHIFFKDEFRYVIVDEAHHSEADTYKAVLAYFDPAVLIGMTAVPERMDDRDIKETFGEAVIEIYLEEGIGRGWLTSVEYHMLSDHINKRVLNQILLELREGGEKISIKQLNASVFIERRDEEIARIILEYGDHGIVFCSGTTYADAFATKLPNAKAMHSKRAKDENDLALAEFKHKLIQFLVAVDMLNEGIDVPHVGLIVFLRPTDSKTIFLQQLGRGLRRMAGKEKVIVLDFVGNCDRVAIVQQLFEQVKDYSDQGLTEYDKGPYFLKGKGFEFHFDDIMRNLQEVLFLLRQRRYISEIPHLFAEFHTTKNAPLMAETVIAGTNQKLWWKCSVATCSHEWQAPGNRRVRGVGCPGCSRRTVTAQNNMLVTHSALATEFHPTKNAPLTAETMIAGTNQKLWWKCSVATCGHEWQTTGNSRVNGTDCPACANRVVTILNCMRTTHPALATEFHPTKNAPLTAETVVAGTQKKLWWKCSLVTCGHEWEAGGNNRICGRGCPACANKTVTIHNRMQITHPTLAAEFHPTKNAPLTKETVVAGTNKKLWWKCSVATCGHEWQTTGNRRTSGRGCPACHKARRTKKKPSS